MPSELVVRFFQETEPLVALVEHLAFGFAADGADGLIVVSEEVGVLAAQLVHGTGQLTLLAYAVGVGGAVLVGTMVLEVVHLPPVKVGVLLAPLVDQPVAVQLVFVAAQRKKVAQVGIF